MRTLVALVNPVDRPSLEDSDARWRRFKEAIPAGEGPENYFERLETTTLTNLSEAIAAGGWDVLHIVSHSQEYPIPGYGSVELTGIDRRSKYVSSHLLAESLGLPGSLRLVILQATGYPGQSFEAVAQKLVDHGLPAAIWTTPLSSAMESAFLGLLYGGLLCGNTLNQFATSFAHVRQAGEACVFLHSRDHSAPVIDAQCNKGSIAWQMSQQVPAMHQIIGEPQSLAREARRLRRELKEQRRLERPGEKPFDVFLCHNAVDKDWVKETALRLMRANILPWLDEWEEQAGNESWLNQLSRGVRHTPFAVICLGANGIGKTQGREINTLLVIGSAGLIPIVLPNAPINVEIPDLLLGEHRIDFRKSDPDPMRQLISAIRRQHPDDVQWPDDED